MILSVSCDRPSFKTVHFEPGFNVVLAQKTQTSTAKDTRNGSGKSLLVEIIRFALGSAGKALQAKEISDWTFIVKLRLAGREITIRRNTDTAKSKNVVVEGDLSGLPIRPSFSDELGQYYPLAEWNMLLGQLLFGLGGDASLPRFSALIAYFIRTERDAYLSPFTNHRMTLEGDKQLFNTYLLGLNWELAIEFEKLKKLKKTLDTLKKAAKEGLFDGLIGTLGELNATKVEFEDRMRREERTLQDFRVEPMYAQIEQTTNTLTGDLHELINGNLQRRRLLEMYQQSLQEEAEPPTSDVVALYAEAGIALPDLVKKRLEEVEAFHHQLLLNRRVFLEAEVRRLTQELAATEAGIRKKTEQRAGLLQTLKTNGSLDEYTRLQRMHLETVQKVNDLESRIQNLRNFESGVSEYKIKLAELVLKAQRDMAERDAVREEAIRQFNAISEALYDSPGRLILDTGDTGFVFDIKIERSDATGIENMKVFCYDLMLAQLWSQRDASPGLLIHDSPLFDGVDERQRAHALHLAAKSSEQYGFQYICLLNEDMIPTTEFSDAFSLDPYVRFRLTDQSNGCLLGIRF
jgi:uncharacterized protein YydD (DUF2326 family)